MITILLRIIKCSIDIIGSLGLFWVAIDWDSNIIIKFDVRKHIQVL